MPRLPLPRSPCRSPCRAGRVLPQQRPAHQADCAGAQQRAAAPGCSRSGAARRRQQQQEAGRGAGRPAGAGGPQGAVLVRGVGGAGRAAALQRLPCRQVAVHVPAAARKGRGWRSEVLTKSLEGRFRGGLPLLNCATFPRPPFNTSLAPCLGRRGAHPYCIHATAHVHGGL